MSIPSELQPLKEPEQWSICRSLHELPVRGLIKCIDGDLSPIVKTGTPPADKIAAGWEDLYSDYAMKAGGTQITALVRRLSAAQVLSSKINRVEMTVIALRLCPVAQLFEVLRIAGYAIHAARLAAGPDSDEYDRILDDVEALLKPLRMKLDVMSDNMPAADKGRKGPTIDEFSDTLRHINEHYKLSLTLDISSYDYCGYVSDMRADVQAQIRATAGINRQSRRNTPAHGAE